MLVDGDLCTFDPCSANFFSLVASQGALVQTTHLSRVGPTHMPLRRAGHVVAHPPPAGVNLQTHQASKDEGCME